MCCGFCFHCFRALCRCRACSVQAVFHCCSAGSGFTLVSDGILTDWWSSQMYPALDHHPAVEKQKLLRRNCTQQSSTVTSFILQPPKLLLRVTGLNIKICKDINSWLFLIRAVKVVFFFDFQWIQCRHKADLSLRCRSSCTAKQLEGVYCEGTGRVLLSNTFTGPGAETEIKPLKQVLLLGKFLVVTFWWDNTFSACSHK